MRRQGGSRVDDDVTESLTQKDGQTQNAKHIHATHLVHKLTNHIKSLLASRLQASSQDKETATRESFRSLLWPSSVYGMPRR